MNNENSKKSYYKNAGHRSRLRERFLKNGIESLLDYEIVELLLTLGTPRKDCKTIAKEAIKKFGGLQKVLDTPLERLQEIKGIGPNNAFGIKLFQEIATRYKKEQVKSNILLDNPKVVFEYLQKSIGREEKEHFIMLTLNSRNQLISVNQIAIGTINASIIHPREVFEPAIRQLANHIIIAHNHPSGEPEPSPEDIALTARLSEVGRIMNIDLVDHVIVTPNKYFSLKEKGLLS